MHSNSLQRWEKARCIELDEILKAHRAVGGAERGRRYATQQVNHAYAVLLSSQFQGSCRDLHSECVQHIVQQFPTPLQDVIQGELVRSRKLDRGNPNSGNLGSDFTRLGLRIWDVLARIDRKNVARRQLLDELIDWRNAIAHQSFDPSRHRVTLRLDKVGKWRQACQQLALAFDSVSRKHLSGLIGTPPW